MAQDIRAVGPVLLLSLAIVAVVSVAGRMGYGKLQASIADAEQSSSVEIVAER